MLTAKDVSLTSLRCLVVDCVYRVQLTHEKDAQILRKFIELLLSTDILQSEKYFILKLKLFQVHLFKSIDYSLGWLSPCAEGYRYLSRVAYGQ